MTFMRAVATFPRGVGAANDGLQRYEALERHTAHRFGTRLISLQAHENRAVRGSQPKRGCFSAHAGGSAETGLDGDVTGLQ
jgi:hypothetical protein